MGGLGGLGRVGLGLAGGADRSDKRSTLAAARARAAMPAGSGACATPLARPTGSTRSPRPHSPCLPSRPSPCCDRQEPCSLCQTPHRALPPPRAPCPPAGRIAKIHKLANTKESGTSYVEGPMQGGWGHNLVNMQDGWGWGGWGCGWVGGWVLGGVAGGELAADAFIVQEFHEFPEWGDTLCCRLLHPPAASPYLTLGPRSGHGCWHATGSTVH